jgi:hypothetical protein
MAYFEYARNENGGTPTIQELYIATGTAIEKGEVVKFTPGTGVAAVTPADLDAQSIGVAAEVHDGATAGRQVGLKIKVITNPDAVFALRSTNVITATGGSTTTFVVAGLLPATDNLWIGGMLHVVACAADSSLNGKDIPITDSTGTGGTITFATQIAAFASGDTAYLCPGPLALTEFGWDLTSDGTDVDWDSSGSQGLQLVDASPENFVSYWKLRLHQFGNSAVSI